MCTHTPSSASSSPAATSLQINPDGCGGGGLAIAWANSTLQMGKLSPGGERTHPRWSWKLNLGPRVPDRRRRSLPCGSAGDGVKVVGRRSCSSPLLGPQAQSLPLPDNLLGSINKRTAAENEFVGLKKVSQRGRAPQGSPSGHCPHRERADCAVCVVYIFSTFLEMRCLMKEVTLSTLLAGKASYNVTNEPLRNVN